MEIEITYCAAWNYKPQADRVSAEIEDLTGHITTLNPGSGGVFDIRCDGEIIFSKFETKRFPDAGEMAELL